MAVINAKILIERDTTANWNGLTGFIPKSGEMILYTDYKTKDGQVYPGIKIGDGLAYLIDLPFLSDEIAEDLQSHISDSTSHVSSSDREFWNSKLNAHVSGDNLVFTRN